MGPLAALHRSRAPRRSTGEQLGDRLVDEHLVLRVERRDVAPDRRDHAQLGFGDRLGLVLAVDWWEVAVGLGLDDDRAGPDRPQRRLEIAAEVGVIAEVVVL